MTPEQTAIVARRTVQGVPGCKIAQELGVHESSICRSKQRPQVRALIESEIAALMERGLKPARRTLCRLAAIGNNVDADKDMLKLSLDASKTILSHANGQPGTIINTLIQINQAPEQAQELSGIAAFLASQWKNDGMAIECSSDEHKDCIDVHSVNNQEGQIEIDDSNTTYSSKDSGTNEMDRSTTGNSTPHTPIDCLKTDTPTCDTHRTSCEPVDRSTIDDNQHVMVGK